MFWILASLLTLLATAALAWPLLRRDKPAGAATERADFDREVFRAQLRELAQDVERRAISPDDAAAARAEIARRLIRLDRAGTAVRPGGRAAAIAALVVALCVPLGAFLAYDRLGSPELGDQPLAGRDPAPAEPTITAVLALIERRLAERPDDAQGWSVVAPIYLRAGDPAKAIHAFREAIRLGADTPATRAGLGEALVRAAGGTVTAEAQDSFRLALQREPDHTAARFFLALALSQDGRVGEARESWSALLRDAPPDAPWRPAAEAALREAQTGGAAEEPGPTVADVDAAAALSASDRAAMVRGMVDGLAERLERDPLDAAGWARLVRSYGVLGDRDRQAAALARALSVFPDGSPERKTVLEAAAAAPEPAAVPEARTP